MLSGKHGATSCWILPSKEYALHMWALSYLHMSCGSGRSGLEQECLKSCILQRDSGLGTWRAWCVLPHLTYCCTVQVSSLAVVHSICITGSLLELETTSLLTTHIFKESTIMCKIPLLLMHIFVSWKEIWMQTPPPRDFIYRFYI